MSKKENKVLKIIISILAALFAGCLFVAFKFPEFSGLFVFFAIVFFLFLLFLVSYHGHCLGLGKIAKEKDLDTDVVYGIDQIVRLKDGHTFLFLEGSINYETEIVEQPKDGFKNFEILDDEYLAPKKLKAQVVNGRLWKPV